MIDVYVGLVKKPWSSFGAAVHMSAVQLEGTAHQENHGGKNLDKPEIFAPFLSGETFVILHIKIIIFNR